MVLRHCMFVLALILWAATSAARAGYVAPVIGGGQVGMMGAPMIHADVGFDGTQLTVTLDSSHGVPQVRPLTPPDEFDPAAVYYAALHDRAYNWQYAWNPGGFISLPAGTGIWMEVLEQSPGLLTYSRPPTEPAWAPILGTEGASARWRWSGAMAHNAYAVENPTQDTYTARYRVYLGDLTTGAPLPGYGAAEVTWTWAATPVPEPATLGLVLLMGGSLVARPRRRG